MDGLSNKFPKFGIRRLTNTDDDFYPLVGPLLSRRNIVAELGSPVWDDDGKVWHIAVNDEGEVFGMVGRTGSEICSMWVVPDRRGDLVGAGLLHAAASDTEDPLRATVKPEAVELFARLGFAESGTKGTYTKMVRGAA